MTRFTRKLKMGTVDLGFVARFPSATAALQPTGRERLPTFDEALFLRGSWKLQHSKDIYL